METALSLRALAVEHGVTATTIARRLQAAGAERGTRVLGRDDKTYPARPYSDHEGTERAAAVHQLWHAGLTVRQSHERFEANGTPVSLGAIVRDRRMVTCPACAPQRLEPTEPSDVHL